MSARWLDNDEIAASTEGYGSKLTWVAKYRDGIEVSQYIDGQAQSSELIDRKRLWIFKLLDKSGKTIISQEFRRGQMPIYRRRTALRPGENVVEVIHILGWRLILPDNSEIIHVAFVYESDFHVEMGEFRKDTETKTRNEEWQYPINFRDIDGIMVE